MRLNLATVLTVLAIASEVVSGAIVSSYRTTLHGHGRLTRRMTRQKRCIQRNPSQSSTTLSSSTPAPTDNGSNNDNSNNNNGNNSNGRPDGTIQSYGSPCDPPNATVNPTETSGPNGSTEWLTCGIRGSGWVPPRIDMDNLIYKSLRDILDSGNNDVFEGCRAFVDFFENAARDTNLPSSLLAAIAMQESSCQPGAIGGAGELGLMQVTGEKCPQDGDCLDPQTNIYIGARYLRSRIDANGGNMLQAMGEYNGWFPNMREEDANNHPCPQRNNLDYLSNVFNAYIQGINPTSVQMGFYYNMCQ